jgi:hypothetical protein
VAYAKGLGKEALEAIRETDVQGLENVVIQMIERDF